MGEIEAGHIHAGFHQSGDLLEGSGGRAQGTNDFRAAHAHYLMSYSLVAFSGLTTSRGGEHNFPPPFTVCLRGMNRE
ncbi:hypothetical protein GCM10009838_31470 [Catenulispora subtropica]|uniref:Uncharacterized protein n=1 Tax=Catenulispora subtropica TaxID=450798 RepID=A0ABN2RJJ1_9ACTN